MPEFKSLTEFNKELLFACDRDMEHEHYEHDDLFISDLFRDDKAAFLPLPEAAFDTAAYITATDKTSITYL